MYPASIARRGRGAYEAAYSEEGQRHPEGGEPPGVRCERPTMISETNAAIAA